MNQETAARRRKVWGMLSENPRLSIREIMLEVDAFEKTIFQDIKWLEGAGYISRSTALARTTRVLIPLLSKEHASE